MSKKKKHEEHENLERWLVSYADFITLLFATFVVLYALSQLDLEKFKLLKISINRAFSPPSVFSDQGPSIMQKQEGEILPNESQGIDSSVIPLISPNLEEKKMEEVKQEIEKTIEKNNIEGVSAKVDSRGLVISLLDSVFFDSGSAYIRPQAVKILDKVAFMIKKDFTGNKIRVEGHTDPDPISTAVFPSNWELSAARASSVVRHFISRFKMPENSFSAVGYADTIPIAPNNTIQGKQKNRRVEIVILNSKTSKLEASGQSGLASPEKPQEPQDKPEDNIQILKGGRTGSNIQELESAPSKPEPEPTPEENTGPINMPVQQRKPAPAPIIGVETKEL